MMRFLPVIAAFILVSCGFSPMYGTASQNKSATVESKLSLIDIAIIPNREGQFLRNELMDRLYRNGIPSNPSYTLKVKAINEAVSNFDITIESEATRRQLRLTTNMVLEDNKTGEAVLKRSLQAITSHNVLESEFSTIVTEQSAREAALNDLARQIELQLTLHFSR